MKLIRIDDLTAQAIHQIWEVAAHPIQPMQGHVAWSFEGNGIRTRTTFIQAFRELNLNFVELPNLLKTTERASDLAGYLDPFYDLYVIRDGQHDRLEEFAKASHRPVINAMSALGHPCEVLTDAYSLQKSFGALAKTKITLWGPTTNVFRSWHELAQVLGLDLVHICDATYHEDQGSVRFLEAIDGPTDVLITDSWPAGFENTAWSLSTHHLEALGQPKLIATPPFHIGQEVGFDPLHYIGFMGYMQKMDLLPVQKAIVSYLMNP
jgi:ornithine carbamoyltransferase